MAANAKPEARKNPPQKGRDIEPLPVSFEVYLRCHDAIIWTMEPRNW